MTEWTDAHGDPTPRLQILVSAVLTGVVVFVAGLLSNIVTVYAAAYALSSAGGAALLVWIQEVYRA